MAVVAPVNKDLRQLVQRLKSGYKLEETGSNHYRILDRNGEPVLLENGKQLTIANTPRAGGRGLKNVEAELERAQVLRGTDHRPQPRARSNESRAGELEVRRERRQAEAERLHTRLAAALTTVGGIDHPQMHRDLGSIGALLARQQNLEGVQGGPISPDLAAENARKVAAHNWVHPRYAGIWEQLAERLEKADDPSEEFFTLVRRAKGIPDPQAIQSKAVEGEWPFRVELLTLEALLVDHSYQRPAAWPFIRREAARFDPSLVGTIDVSERRRGAIFAILDGQQRMEICRMTGKTTIWCSIYAGLDIASEARFFLHKNRDRKVVHPYYTFRARVTANDPDAMKMDEIVSKYGYALAITAPKPDTSVENNISAIAAVEQAYLLRDPDGNERLSPTLEILKRSTLGRQNGQNGIMIRGLASLLAQYPLLDDRHLGDVIAARGPDFLLGKSREGRYGGGSSGVWMARTLRDEYNRGLTRETKLTGDTL